MTSPDHPRRDQLPRGGRARHRLPRRRARPRGRPSAWRPTSQLCAPCAEYVEQIRTTARLAAVAAVELELQPDRDAFSTPSRSSRHDSAKEFSDEGPMTGSNVRNLEQAEPPRPDRRARRRGRDGRDGRPCGGHASRRSVGARVAPRGGCRSRPTRPSSRLIESVAAATAKAETIDEALQACVEHVCRWTGWPVGHVYLAGKDEHDPLQPSNIWYLGHPTKFEAFRARHAAHAAARAASACRAASPPPAAPPGSSTSPATRTSRAPRPAPRSACAARSRFPIPIGDETFAVIECFSLQRRHAGRPPARGHRAHRPPARPR